MLQNERTSTAYWRTLIIKLRDLPQAVLVGAALSLLLLPWPYGAADSASNTHTIIASGVQVFSLPARHPLALTTPTVYPQPTQQSVAVGSSGPSADTWAKDLIDLFKVLISWPVVAALAIFLLYKPLTRFLTEFGGQNVQSVKVSILQFGVEVSKATGLSPSWNPAGVDLRFASGNDIGGSAGSTLLAQFAGDQPLDYVVIDIGDGRQWLTTRLYLVALMLERMRALRCLVFVQTTPDVPKRFVGTAAPSAVRWTLATLYPWLEATYVRALFLTQYVPYGPPPPHPIVNLDVTTPVQLPWRPALLHQIGSSHGVLVPQDAERVVQEFLQDPNIQQPLPPLALSLPLSPAPPTTPPPPPPLAPPWPQSQRDVGHWEHVLRTDGTQFWEHAHWIDHAWLSKLGDILHDGDDAYLISSPDVPQSKQTQAILRRTGTFVALVDADRQFRDLVDRESVQERVIAGLNNLLEEGGLGV